MTFRITQGDTSPTILSELNDSGDVIDLTGADVRFIMENKYEEVVIDDDTSGAVNIVDQTGGQVEYEFSSTDTEQVGSYRAEWEVTFPSGAVETFPTGHKIDVEIIEQIA